MRINIYRILILGFIFFSDAFAQDVPAQRVRTDTLKTKAAGTNDSIHVKSRMRHYRTEQFDSTVVFLSPIARAYTNAKIALLNGLSDSAQVLAIDTTITGAPSWASAALTHTLRLPFARMKDTSFTNSVSNVVSTNSFLSVGTAGKTKRLTIDTTKTFNKLADNVITNENRYTARQHLTSMAVDTIVDKSNLGGLFINDSTTVLNLFRVQNTTADVMTLDRNINTAGSLAGYYTRMYNASNSYVAYAAILAKIKNNVTGIQTGELNFIVTRAGSNIIQATLDSVGIFKAVGGFSINGWKSEYVSTYGIKHTDSTGAIKSISVLDVDANGSIGTEIQNALNALPDNAELLLPSGRWTITSVDTIKSNNIQIVGRGTTLAVSGAGGGQPTFNFFAQSKSGIKISGIRFVGTNQDNQTAIFFRNVSNSIIFNNIFDSLGLHSIGLRNTNDVSMNADSGSSNNIITRNNFNYSTNSLHAIGVFIFGGSNYNIVSNNNFIGCETAIVVDDGTTATTVPQKSLHNNIVGNVIVKSSLRGINVEGSSQNLVVSNNIDSCGTGIYMNNVQSGNGADSNIVASNMVSRTSFGIKITAGNRNFIHGNSISRSTNGIFVEKTTYGGSDSSATGNIIQSNYLLNNVTAVKLADSKVISTEIGINTFRLNSTNISNSGVGTINYLNSYGNQNWNFDGIVLTDTIKSNTPSKVVFINDTLSVSGSATIGTNLSTTNGSATFTRSGSGDILLLQRSDSAVNNTINQYFRSKNTAGSFVNYASIRARIQQNIAGIETGTLLWLLSDGGVSSIKMTLDTAALTLASGVNLSIGSRVTSLNGASTSGDGVVSTPDTVVWTAQTGSIAAQNFANTTTGRQYRATYTLITTTASGSGSPTISLTVSYNNGSAAKTQTSALLDLATLGDEVNGSFIFYLGSGTPTWNTTLAGASGTPQYAIRMTLERL